MIPRTLHIKNFISYGNELQTINFEPYHLIYLSGKNGHGKSALLDAITWAIWGHARKVITAVKADQGLMRLGQTNMLVMLDFQLNGELYRVRRELSLIHGKPVVQLEFGILNPDTDSVIPLTDKTIRTTQTKIEETIRLDYEAFINSAFLRQGHANEFSQKSPKDRKDILCSILGLQQFDVIRRRALEKVKNALAEKQAYTVLNEKIMQQLSQQQSIDQQWSLLLAQLEKIKEQEATYTTTKNSLDNQRNMLLQQRQQQELIKFKQSQITTEIEKQITLLTQQVKAWRNIHRSQLRMPNLDELEKLKRELVEHLAIHQTKLQNALIIKERILQSREIAHQMATQLEKNNQNNLQTYTLALERLKYEDQTQLVTFKTLETQKKNLETELVEQEKLLASHAQAQLTQESLEKLQGHFERRKEGYQQFIAHGNWLKSELDNLEQKTELTHGDDPSCPLCEQNLSLSRRKFLKTKFVKQKDLITHQLARITRVVKKLKQILLEQHQVLESRKAAHAQSLEVIKNKDRIARELESTNQHLALITQQRIELVAKIEQAQKALDIQRATCLQAIQNDQNYRTIQDSLKQLELEEKNIAYDQTEHHKSQDKLTKLEKELARYQELQQEIQRQHERIATIGELISQIRSARCMTADLTKEIAAYATVDQAMHNLENQEKQCAAQSTQMLREKETLLQQQGNLAAQIDQLHKLTLQSKEQQVAIAQLAQIADDYQTIANAAGKDGVQALLIEEAIPEIEQEANYLLAKLTNNQAHIFIESLRDLKKGGSKETLDIKISDPSGIRSYELFSGGEAFRIDFALRIAISKLLARRAGTALQTLIIDEGFGSQDEEGLSHIMDAIHKIQDDFEKVIVVSHLPSMKDEFPVHFMVEKGPNGSHVNIMEVN